MSCIGYTLHMFTTVLQTNCLRGMKKNTYHIFEIANAETYLFSDIGFNNDESFSYDKIQLWRFHNENTQIHFLQINNYAFCPFGKSEKLLNFLQSMGVELNEFEIRSVEDKWTKKKLILSNNHQLNIIDAGRRGFYYDIDKDGKRLFTLRSDIINDPLNIFNKKVSLKFKGSDDRSGQLPQEVERQIKKTKQVERRGKIKRRILGTLAFIFAGIFLLILIFALLYRYDLI